MTIPTRLFHPDDLPDLLDMIAGLARFHDDVPTVRAGDLRRDLCGPQPWYTVIVAQAPDAGPHGYAALTRMGQLQFGVRGMDIHHLFVRDGARGNGVGTALLAACQAQARAQGCAFLSVGTHPDNTAAGRFYETRGFTRRSGSGPRFSQRLDRSDQPPT